MLGAFSKPADAQDQSAKSAASNLFDGKSLQGWSGLTANWSVQDGAITGENKADAPIGQNTFLVYDKPVKDFELTLEFRIMGGNSGIQYRSKIFDKDKFVVGGYQADIDANKRYMGINYEERGRGILAERGEIVAVDAQGKKSGLRRRRRCSPVANQMGRLEPIQDRRKRNRASTLHQRPTDV